VIILIGSIKEDQQSVIHCLGPEGLKTSEIYRRMTVQYGSNCMNQRKVLFTGGWKDSKGGWKCVVDDTCPGQSSTTEWCT
jgi:hypothetical protein